jgi:hypothetical protein
MRCTPDTVIAARPASPAGESQHYYPRANIQGRGWFAGQFCSHVERSRSSSAHPAPVRLPQSIGRVELLDLTAGHIEASVAELRKESPLAITLVRRAASRLAAASVFPSPACGRPDAVVELLAFALALVIATVIGVFLLSLIAMVLPERFTGGDPDAWVVCTLAVVWVLLGQNVLTGRDLTVPPTSFEFVVVGFMTLVALWTAGVGGIATRWVPWRKLEWEPPFRIYGMLLAWVALTEAFTAILVLLGQAGAITMEPPLVGPDATSASANASRWRTIEGLLVWNLLDMVPSLKVPTTINWTLSFKITDSLGGLVVLGYKLLVIVPLIGLVRSLLKPPESPTKNEQGDDEGGSDGERAEELNREADIARMRAAGGTGPIDG